MHSVEGALACHRDPAGGQEESVGRGIEFGPAHINLDQLRGWKDSILEKLGQGIKGLAQKRGVELIHGRGHFEDSQTLRVETSEGQKFIRYGESYYRRGFEAGDAFGIRSWQ